MVAHHLKTLLGHALVKDENGREMHKSWGNAIWFDDAAEKMGVDVMRWMYAGQNLENTYFLDMALQMKFGKNYYVLECIFLLFNICICRWI